jgi:hypothetical protein
MMQNTAEPAVGNPRSQEAFAQGIVVGTLDHHDLDEQTSAIAVANGKAVGPRCLSRAGYHN